MSDLSQHPDPAGLLDELERLKDEYEGCFAEDGLIVHDSFEAWDAYKGELWENRDALLSLARDGLRYRALRERCDPMFCGDELVSLRVGNPMPNISQSAVDLLDAAIDAAMGREDGHSE